MVKAVNILLCTLYLGLLSVKAFASSQGFTPLTDAHETSVNAEKAQKVFILYVGASYCGYCKKLEKEVLTPVLGNKGYQQNTVIRRLLLDSEQPVVGFAGTAMSQETFLQPYNIRVTPTLLFLNSTGAEVTRRLEGYQSDEFYWHYLDTAIESAKKSL